MKPGEAIRKAATSPLGVELRRRVTFRDSGRYWEKRYASGETSGSGSYGPEAEWKAAQVNAWVAQLGVSSVIDWGCGDANQLSLGDYPRYFGLDRSPTAIRTCIDRFAHDRSKSFLAYDPETLHDGAGWLRADMALSMEVLFHLVEDEIFDDYLGRVFDSAERYVVIVNSDEDIPQTSPHELHRRFTPWVKAYRPDWRLKEVVPPPEDIALVSAAHLYVRS